MSSFEILGTVTKIENLTSLKGNQYCVFTVKDASGKTFELSLFGDSMEFLEKLKVGAPATVKGVLGSREFQDKNGKTRYGVELKTQWVEIPEKPTSTSGVIIAKQMTGDDFDLDAIPF